MNIRPAHPRPRKKRWVRRLLWLALLAGVSAAYARWVEPYWIEVTHHRVKAPVEAPLKIAHVTDLHTDGMGRRERRLLALLEREQPDVIVITGDTPHSVDDNPGVLEVLRSLRAPLGVWLVRGNWENWQRFRKDHTYYESAGVRFLLNQGGAPRSDVWLAGVDDPSTEEPDLAAALVGAPPRAYTIALFHAPGYFDRTAGSYQLALAGHTHGGQVRIPFLPPLWLPEDTGRFVEGWYQNGASRMYVSRGVGTSILDFRFFCRPELAIITLEP